MSQHPARSHRLLDPAGRSTQAPPNRHRAQNALLHQGSDASVFHTDTMSISSLGGLEGPSSTTASTTTFVSQAAEDGTTVVLDGHASRQGVSLREREDSRCDQGSCTVPIPAFSPLSDSATHRLPISRPAVIVPKTPLSTKAPMPLCSTQTPCRSSLGGLEVLNTAPGNVPANSSMNLDGLAAATHNDQRYSASATTFLSQAAEDGITIVRGRHASRRGASPGEHENGRHDQGSWIIPQAAVLTPSVSHARAICAATLSDYMRAPPATSVALRRVMRDLPRVAPRLALNVGSLARRRGMWNASDGPHRTAITVLCEPRRRTNTHGRRTQGPRAPPHVRAACRPRQTDREDSRARVGVSGRDQEMELVQHPNSKGFDTSGACLARALSCVVERLASSMPPTDSGWYAGRRLSPTGNKNVSIPNPRVCARSSTLHTLRYPSDSSVRAHTPKRPAFRTPPPRTNWLSTRISVPSRVGNESHETQSTQRWTRTRNRALANVNATVTVLVIRALIPACTRLAASTAVSPVAAAHACSVSYRSPPHLLLRPISRRT
ncbi:hypothetical protein EVG20_g7468 [Dentipellis fragilis]|uniref:Uncharacterized protein n=1 Tax=Dentipellis fragilis TaxID=205917 RepID=A0A4Y9YFG5_9AGAM|nr:hypothetical protein EVG20_g7468 [Dentipellis fragilis]